MKILKTLCDFLKQTMQTVFVFFYITIILFSTETYAGLGSAGNIESADITETNPLPDNFSNIVTKLEKHFHKEWHQFDLDNKSKETYYGIIRGNAFGEFKAALDLISKKFDIIFLYSQYLSGYGISTGESSPSHNIDKELNITTNQIGHDRWGNVEVSIYALTTKNKQFMTGKYNADHGWLGMYSGKLLGIHLPSKINNIATIKNKALIQQILSIK